MFRVGTFEQLNDYFTPLSARRGHSVFFGRIAANSADVTAFIKRYYTAARKNGVIIDGRIPNPDSGNLAYFSEMMGTEFKNDRSFLSERLKKWLPRMSEAQRESVVSAIDSTLQDMLRNGKNEEMLRNAYIKYMCWLYYKFERILHLLGAEEPPKILYDGTISQYELQLLVVLSRAGADIVLLERGGEANYLRLDPRSEYSQLYQEPGMHPFTEAFSLKGIQAELGQEAERQRLYGTPPSIRNCTNAWMNQAEIKEVLTGAQARGSDAGFFYNAFILQYGVEDKLLFSNDLFSFYQQLKSERRNVLVVNGRIPAPTPEEIAQIRRRNYTTVDQLIADLVPNIRYPASIELQRLMVKSFIDIVLEESAGVNGNVLKLTSKAVYLLAWLKRYEKELFLNWTMPEVAVFILFGGCESANEALFLRMLARLPVDVLVLVPNLSVGCALRDTSLLEVKYDASLSMDAFPVEQAQIRVQTAAYQAERDLDTLMYQDTGMYRNQQYAKAETVTLQTMYEEISILWDQEMKYRPSFAVLDETVTLPVLFEKICGVKDGQINQYWLDIKKLITPDTFVIKQVPWITSLDANPMKPFATQFLHNGRLQKNKIKSHKAYPYGILRPEMQDYLLDKLQVLLDQKVIAGTYENGTEYAIIATVLNLNMDLVRLIQKFDFTKKNPKVVVINTTEKILSLEDSIVLAFLSLVGFDVLFFVPTGYQCIEKYFQDKFINEHQIGEYLYDLSVPDFNSLQEGGLHSFRRIFGRSN